MQGGKTIEQEGVESVIISDSEFFLEEGAPKLSLQAHWRWLWECSSELYMNVSSIERLDTPF